MRTWIVSAALVAGLIAGPALAESGNKVHSDHSTRASHTQRTVARGPDHAHLREQRKCQNMGFRLGTDGFANCLLQLETNRTQRRAAEANAQAIRDAATIKAKADKDMADRDAWDARTGQGRYANQPRVTIPQGSTEPPPAFDRYGNANYNENGEYVGAHGLGTSVDNPDFPTSNSTSNDGWSSDPVGDAIRQDQANIDASMCSAIQAGDPTASCN